MKRPIRKFEVGQSFVLLALAFVGMLGFAGLAIDGGIVYTERRHAQNAADAASLAGALAKLNSGNLYTSAYGRANDNGYDNNTVDNWVEVYNPPIEGVYAGNAEYIQVKITSIVDSVFAHFVFSGPLQNTVNAVARAKPAQVYPFAQGDAMVGLSETGCSVVWSHGTANTTINGSNVHVNSNDPNCAFRANGSNDFEVNGGGINVVGGWEIGNNANVSPIPTGGATPMDMPVIPPPTCSGNGTRSGGTATPGNHSDFRFNSGSWTLQPGIYCVTGDFRVNAGVTLTGNNVTIYLINGALTWNGTATINLDAPDDGPYAGLLIYQAVGNTNRATINGSSGSSFYGTMFFPDAEAQINGTGGTTGFHSQVVADKVDMSGTSEMVIHYDPTENYMVREPARVDLTE